MPVPTSISDLSTTAASNSPAGTDAVTSSTGPDEYIRALSAILRSVSDAKANTGNVPVDTHAATSKATPVDADEIPLADSAASYGLKKLTWANLKATLKSYFDTLYMALVAPGTSGNVMTSNGSAWTSAAMSGFGYGQTWQNVTGSRANNVTYYNTTNKPIFISIWSGYGASGDWALYVNGVVIDVDNQGAAEQSLGVMGAVPVGSSYYFVSSGAAINTWIELR